MKTSTKVILSLLAACIVGAILTAAWWLVRIAFILQRWH